MFQFNVYAIAFSPRYITYKLPEEADFTNYEKDQYVWDKQRPKSRNYVALEPLPIKRRTYAEVIKTQK